MPDESSGWVIFHIPATSPAESHSSLIRDIPEFDQVKEDEDIFRVVSDRRAKRNPASDAESKEIKSSPVIDFLQLGPVSRKSRTASS